MFFILLKVNIEYFEITMHDSAKKYFSQSSLEANPSATMWLQDYYGEIEVPLWVLNLVNKKIKNELRRKLEDYFSRV